MDHKFTLVLSHWTHNQTINSEYWNGFIEIKFHLNGSSTFPDMQCIHIEEFGFIQNSVTWIPINSKLFCRIMWIRFVWLFNGGRMGGMRDVRIKLKTMIEWYDTYLRTLNVLFWAYRGVFEEEIHKIKIVTVKLSHGKKVGQFDLKPIHALCFFLIDYYHYLRCLRMVAIGAELQVSNGRQLYP